MCLDLMVFAEGLFYYDSDTEMFKVCISSGGASRSMPEPEPATAKNGSISIYTGYAYTINKKTAKICLNSKADIIYIFEHKGHLFKVTIPAGTDLSEILDKNGFAGPLWIGKELGTCEFLK